MSQQNRPLRSPESQPPKNRPDNQTHIETVNSIYSGYAAGQSCAYAQLTAFIQRSVCMAIAQGKAHGDAKTGQYMEALSHRSRLPQLNRIMQAALAF